MTEENKGNVILFPKTTEYYQVQLTRMLESERYTEAVELLKFLLRCKGERTAAYEEWSMLLAWLQHQLDNLELTDVTEEDLMDDNVQHKAKHDHLYIEKLLQLIKGDAALAQKMLALEQLRFVEHPEIERVLRQWILQTDLHPLIQFKILQTLKKVGATGTLELYRHGENVRIDIQDVPMQMKDFPVIFHRIIEEVQRNCDIHHPALSYFVEHLWEEVLYSTYATRDYRKMLQISSEHIQEWAASLHFQSEKMMLGKASEKSVLHIYHLDESNLSQWNEANELIGKYVRDSLPMM